MIKLEPIHHYLAPHLKVFFGYGDEFLFTGEAQRLTLAAVDMQNLIRGIDWRGIDLDLDEI